MLVGCGVSLGQIEGDVARCERLEDRLGKVGETQPAFDETLGKAETLGDSSGVAVFLDEVLEGLALLGGRHLQPLEVFRERDLASVVLAAVDDEAGHLEIGLHRAALDDPVHGAHPLAAADDLEASPLLRFGDDEVLQDAARLDIVGKAFFELGVRAFADIVLALVELAQRNELHLLDS